MSERAQIGIVWWALALTATYGLVLGFLLHMIPPPDATMSAVEIARWYADHAFSIKVGATIASWTSAFMLPLWAVIGIQIARQEKGRPIWAVMAVAGGAMMSIFLVLPPLFWGVAAFTPGRSADTTAMMHELGVLTLTTTDQYYIFNWVAVVVICLRPQIAPHSPFPRWFGYFSAWIGMMFEAGAMAFNFRTGPFSWNGLLVFWSPLSLFGLWIGVMAYLLLKSLKLQRQDAVAAEENAAVLV
jgi:hypothetical protein